MAHPVQEALRGISTNPAVLSHNPKTEDFVINLIHERVTAAEIGRAHV